MEIKHNFELLHLIGEGGFAKVVLAMKKTGDDAGVLYALKIAEKSDFEENKHLAVWCKREQQVGFILVSSFVLIFQ